MFSNNNNNNNNPDPFHNGFFLGAFDKQGNPTIVSSLLPILSNDTKPSAKAISTAICNTKNVYFRSLCLIYLRYRLTPENIQMFFGPSVSSDNNKSSTSIFSTLGKIYDDSNNVIPETSLNKSAHVLCPLLDTSLIQTSFDGSSTMTMKEFSRSLLLEDELVEFWLPTYPKFAVESFSKYISRLDSFQQEKVFAKIQEQKKQQQQNLLQENNNKFQTVRRGRNEIESSNKDNKNDQHQKPKNSADGNVNTQNKSSMLMLPSGIKSMTQFAALMQEQSRQLKEQEELKKQEQLEKERKLREQFAGTVEEQVQRREIFQREAAALKDRRRREVLERLKSTADANDKNNIFSSSTTNKNNNNGKTHQQHQQHSAFDAKISQIISAMVSSNSVNYFPNQNNDSSVSVVVDGSLLNRSVIYFGANPPPFASLPPSNKESTSALAQLCSSTTVGTDDVFVCF
jgi:hypothetical protein